MDYSKFSGLPIIDSHIHYGHPAYMAGLMDVMDLFGIERFNIVCTPDQSRLSLVPDALHLKAHYPERVYIFGGLDISALYSRPDRAGEFFAQYVDKLLAMGCDGIKMLEGKPQLRKMLPIPDFDSEIYDLYWSKLAEQRIPLIFHVNDPEEFWDKDKVPGWARDRGWFYGDGTYIDNEVQYSQVLNVLDRYPDLSVIFAHFFFLSSQLERLESYLLRFPNMCVDLTPGIEMYRNFAEDPDKTRAFFLKFQDRILFGTDIGAKALLARPEKGIELGESGARIELVRTFLESDAAFKLDDPDSFLFGEQEEPFRGINLPQSVLEKIYYRNFERLVGSHPRKLNAGLIVAECERLISMIGSMEMIQPEEPGDPSISQMVKSYFGSLV